MKEYLVKVGDQFNIESRLKEIDSTYEVFYNKKEGRYEVFSTKNGVWGLSFVSPYNELDARLIKYARRTRVERMESEIKKMEVENEKIIKKEEARLKEVKRAEILEKLKAAKAGK